MSGVASGTGFRAGLVAGVSGTGFGADLGAGVLVRPLILTIMLAFLSSARTQLPSAAFFMTYGKVETLCSVYTGVASPSASRNKTHVSSVFFEEKSPFGSACSIIGLEIRL